MAKKVININKASFLSMILCFIILFSVLAPTVNAATIVEDNIEENIQKLKEDAKLYENNNNITGEIIDFSNIKKFDFSGSTKTYGNLANNHYEINKVGNNYKITLSNLTAKKIILPADDADLEKLTEGVIKYKGDPRKTNITIELKGTNKITGYGIEGYPVKGIEIKGTGDLIVNAFSEPKVERVSKPQGKDWIQKAELNYYTKAGISVETGDRKYAEKDLDSYEDVNSLVFASTGSIIINAPKYYGIINNGDIKFKSGNVKIESNKSAISGYRIIVGDEANKEDKEFKFELISQERAFYDKPTIQVNNHIIYASKSGVDNAELKSKEDVENSYTSYHYINAKFVDEDNAPIISEDNIKQDGVYCSLPTVTVTDDTAIDTITVNGTKLTYGFIVNTAKKKTFKVPALNNAQKEIVVTDIFGNKAEISFTAHEFHQLSEPNVTIETLPTCTTKGYHLNTYTCTICKQTIRTERVADQALGHTFTDWEITENSRKRECSICGYKEVEDTTVNIANTNISLSNMNFIYDGREKEPIITVKDKNETLINGKDYTVEYKNNLKAGTATVAVSGKDHYKGTVDKNFVIQKANNVITASNITRNYSKNAQNISIVAKQIGDAKLTYNSDNKSVTVNSSGKVTIAKGFSGKATITITADETQGYNKATKKITITISKLNNSIIASNFTKKYSSKAQSFSIGARQIGDAKLTYSSDNKSVTVNSSGKVTIAKGFSGKATITITANATQAYNKATKKITITMSKLNNSIVASNFTKKYSSKAQSFSIGARQIGNAKLTYSSNSKSVTVNSSGKVTIAKGFVGKAIITITANATQGYNKATKKITVIVNPPAITISALSNTAGKKMSIKWSKNSVATGYQIQYSTDKNFKKGVKTITITKNSTISNTVTNLTKNKTYYVRIRSYKTVSNVKYYSSWTVKNIKIKK